MERIIKLIQWVIFLWNDHDFDSHYLLRVMQYKLKRTRLSIMRGYHLHKERDAFKIRICELLLQRIMDDNYADYEYEQAKKEYNISTGLEGFKQVRELPPKERKGYEHKMQLWVKKYNLQQQQDLELFCKIFKKQVLSWWD